LLQVFRPLMRDIELDAEHVEQLVLAEIVRNRPAEPVADAVRANDAEQSVLRYLDHVDVLRDPPLNACVARMLTAAFPGETFPAFD